MDLLTSSCFFFFQAEDGIRDDLVTGVQTCALPILLHFHIGSQVPDILIVKRAVQEAARFYAKLQKMGFPIEYLDVGGGLGVDYDGSRSAFDSSTNYTLQEYANDIVYYIADVCNAEK